MDLAVILHNIRSAHNVGAIFRTADGAGASKIYLTGYTPAPVDRFGRVDSSMEKTSLGATRMVPYESRGDIHALIQELKRAGFAIVAVEQTNEALNFRDYLPQGPIACILGNEVTGIEEAVLKEADTHLVIPLFGSKESLNVSVAAGIVLFHLRQG